MVRHDAELGLASKVTQHAEEALQRASQRDAGLTAGCLEESEAVSTMRTNTETRPHEHALSSASGGAGALLPDAHGLGTTATARPGAATLKAALLFPHLLGEKTIS